MNVAARDPWIAISRNHGYSAAFLKQARVKLMEEALAREGMAILRRHGMPDWALTIVREVCGRVGVRVSDVASRTKHRKVVLARNEAMYLIKARKPDVSMPMMGRWFNRDHTAVLYGIASHQDLAALPRLVGYDLDRVRQRNAEFVMRYTLRRALDSAARELKERREKQE